jgi:hypothetical protein
VTPPPPRTFALAAHHCRRSLHRTCGPGAGVTAPSPILTGEQPAYLSPLSPFPTTRPCRLSKSSLLCPLPVLSPRLPPTPRLVSSRFPPPAAGGAATAEARGEERGAMRMLSRACSVVASSLPRCSSSSAAAPTVASLSPSLPRVFPFPRDRKVVVHRGLDLGPVSFHRSASPWPATASVRPQQHWRFLHARPSLASLFLGHSCLLIPVPLCLVVADIDTRLLTHSVVPSPLVR